MPAGRSFTSTGPRGSGSRNGWLVQIEDMQQVFRTAGDRACPDYGPYSLCVRTAGGARGCAARHRYRPATRHCLQSAGLRALCARGRAQVCSWVRGGGQGHAGSRHVQGRVCSARGPRLMPRSDGGGYFVEGHVSADGMKRLLVETPDVRGLVVPDMAPGSPAIEQGYPSGLRCHTDRQRRPHLDTRDGWESRHQELDPAASHAEWWSQIGRAVCGIRRYWRAKRRRTERRQSVYRNGPQ